MLKTGELSRADLHIIKDKVQSKPPIPLVMYTSIALIIESIKDLIVAVTIQLFGDAFEIDKFDQDC
jgi:hypothetical protein